MGALAGVVGAIGGGVRTAPGGGGGATGARTPLAATGAACALVRTVTTTLPTCFSVPGSTGLVISVE
jgi:hypothetical protein